MGERWQTSVAELLRARVDDPATAVMWVGRDGVRRRVSWAEHVRRSAVRAAWLADRLPAAGEGARHVGVLMENVPEFSYLLGAAALAGVTVVGLNPSRGAAEVVRDARHTDCALIITEERFRAFVGESGGCPVVSVDAAEQWAGMLRDFEDALLPDVDADLSDVPFMLILTSGTTTAPKAVICSQGKIATQGSKAAEMRGLTKEDVLYCAMPLFHSNAVILSWVPAVATGGALALRRRFSASEFLADVRRFGATYANYVGKPLAYVLATEERPDDADNPLRQVFGNEAAPADVERFAKRFGCTVTDGFGSTEGGITFVRLPGTPPNALGVPVGDVRIVDVDSGEECPRAVFDGEGRLANADQAIGEMVNFAGAGAFEGYYAHPEADEARLRDGRFWSGDLAYRDGEGNFYFAGRVGDWIRVGGENFAAAPISRVVEEWPGALLAAAYGVPDVAAGDQVMVALEPRGGAAAFDPVAFGAYLASQTDLPPLWWPRYVRLVEALPKTATNKVVVRDLAKEGWRTDDPVYFRPERSDAFQLMTGDDRDRLAAEFERHGRELLRG